MALPSATSLRSGDQLARVSCSCLNMALNRTGVLQAFVPQWGTRGNDITPLAELDRHFGGTSMFSKVALMFSSCLKRTLFGEWGASF